MQSVYKLIDRVANLDVSVLVTGDTGTGKDLIARAIHNLGNRSTSPFVPVSCGAISALQLFGHAEDRSACCNKNHTGFFEQAANGTVFLDEIGEFDLETQAQLVQVLQQRQFKPYGSHRSIPLQARLVCATQNDLERRISERAFRPELYYRVNVINIRAPRLRERAEDIPILTRHFLKKYSAIYGKRVIGICPDAVQILQAHHWPGNVRELENTIRTAIICADTDVIRSKDLPQNVAQDNRERPGLRAIERSPGPAGPPL
jgi:DNA-binding NtrC family response regulator